MKEHKQIFVIMYCKLCSEETGSWGRAYKVERQFISHTNDPNKFICGSCGCSIRLTEKELKNAQLNSESGRI